MNFLILARLSNPLLVKLCSAFLPLLLFSFIESSCTTTVVSNQDLKILSIIVNDRVYESSGSDYISKDSLVLSWQHDDVAGSNENGEPISVNDLKTIVQISANGKDFF